MALVKTEDLVAQVQGFGALPVVKQLGLMVALAATIALGVAVVLWSQTPNYSLLYANLSAQDLAGVATSLDDAGIPYKVEHGSGSILVPSSKVHDLRLRLAAQGLPQSNEVGFELMEKESGFGTSRFLERARYQRALEGELAKSINSLSSVESARVHLAIPKKSVFLRERAKPSASVLVRLRPGGTLNETQVAGIVHLLAASVPGLEPEAVTVVDQRGRLLSDTQTQRELALNASQFEYNRRLEEEYTKRILEILSPIVGAAGVRAQVTADLDFTVMEETREIYKPDQAAVRSERIKEQQTTDGEPEGVPGALSNQPPRRGSLNTTEVGRKNLNKLSKEVVRNYEVDRAISHSKYAPGRIKRLSIAVVLDYRKQLDEKGNMQQSPLEQAELERITELVKKAVGFDAARNDSINVINIPFQNDSPAEGEDEGIPLWQQSWIWDLARPLAGALFVLLLSLGVLRPMLKNLAETGRIIESETNAQRLPQGAGAAAVAGLPVPEEQPGAGAEAARAAATATATAAAAGGGAAEPSAAAQQVQEGAAANLSGVDIAVARSLVQQDPKRVAQVVKTWVAADE